MWSPEHSTGVYATREDFMEACIPIIKGELQRLTSLGMDAIQLDDPWLALLVVDYLQLVSGSRNVEHEIEMAVQGVNGAVEGVDHPLISVHLCHAHANRRHSTRGPYDLIVGALGRMRVQRFAMEFATPDAGGIEVLAQFPDDKLLGLGVIDHTDIRAGRAVDAESRLRVCAVEYQSDGSGRGLLEIAGAMCGGRVAAAKAQTVNQQDSDSREEACSDNADERRRAERVTAVARFRRRRAKFGRIKMTSEEILADIREGRRR